jgi:hypothetical protein
LLAPKLLTIQLEVGHVSSLITNTSNRGGRQMSIEKFVSTLESLDPRPNCVNPYRGWRQDVDTSDAAPRTRAEQLKTYLDRRASCAKLILIAEAPGYQGARFSGIAMTSERALLGRKKSVTPEDILGTQSEGQRTSSPSAARNRTERQRGFNEPTATVVWKELLTHRLAKETILWNVFPFHPHEDGNFLSNRTPSDDEVTGLLDVAETLIRLFPERRIIAVGKTAANHLSRIKTGITQLRHPANGGTPEFRAGFAKAVADL